MEFELRPKSPPAEKKPAKSRKWWLIIGGVVVLILIIVGAAIWVPSHNAKPVDTNPIPAAQRSQVNFPLYYPKHLPTGMSVDPASFSAADGVLLYTLKYGNNQVVISTQPLTSKLEYDELAKDPDGKAFVNSIGKAVVLGLPNRTTATVFTDKSLIVINATPAIATDTMQDLVNSLQPVK